MKMKNKQNIIAAALISALAQDAPRAEKIREEQAYTVGTSAYVWGFTMNELYRIRSAFLATPGNAVNKFEHIRELVRIQPGSRRGSAPA